MASKAVSAKNLVALGADRLAELLLDIAAAEPAIKRRLRLELAGADDSAIVAREVRKRLTAIERSRSFVDWRDRKALVADLEMQRRTIVGQVAKSDPGEAYELLWRFVELADGVLNRSDDNGTVSDVFRAACDDLGSVAVAAAVPPDALADRAFEALKDNGFGQYDGLIAAFAPCLGTLGLDRLKASFLELANVPEPPPPEPRRVVGWGMDGALYADDVAASRRKSAIRLALLEIADQQGDVDGFIALHDEKARRVPHIAAEIGRRLLKAGRGQEALAAIDAVDRKPIGAFDKEWEEARTEVLEALGRTEEAQALRWARFERRLDAGALRAYLKRLPDFDDLDAEERALEFVQTKAPVSPALAFFLEWPALERAAKLVLGRAGELDGKFYELLRPGAETLADKHPLAASLLLRAMIDDTLKHARTKRYTYAARHLSECAKLAGTVEDFGAFPSHDAYVARLKANHRLKHAFWAEVG